MIDKQLSIIVPNYNSGELLHKLLRSIELQTYVDYELLIVDNDSESSTKEIAKQYCDKYDNWFFFSEKDHGIYDAINKGIQLASGRWIYIIGSDDYLMNQNVLYQLFANRRIEECDMFYGDVLWGPTGAKYDGKFNWIKLFEKNICHQAIFYKKKLFESFGLYNMRYPQLADYEFNLKLFNSAQVNIRYIDVVIAYFSGTGVSRDNNDPFKKELSKRVKWEILRNKNILQVARYFLYQSIKKGFHPAYLELRYLISYGKQG